MATTWLLNFQQVAAESAAAAELLQFGTLLGAATSRQYFRGHNPFHHASYYYCAISCFPARILNRR